MRQKTLRLFNDYYEQISKNQFQRSLSALYLFDFLDRLQMMGFPLNWYSLLERELASLSEVTRFFEESFETSFNSFAGFDEDNAAGDVQKKTGEVYFKLWKNFNKEEYYSQAYAMLKERLKKNVIRLDGVKHALDDGCGGGRYSLALKKLGCARVSGVDISVNSIALARSMNPFNDSQVQFSVSSVLELPFEPESFDFVFSNGVLHHTRSTEQGISEIFRVLKKGGRCWLYLYGGKESFFWDIVSFCRKLLAAVPQSYTQALMKVMGYPPGRIFHRADFFYVPINNRYFAAEVEQLLQAVGFVNFRRLIRGAAHDWDEIMFSTPHIDPYIYGEGEMRYFIKK